MVRKKGFTLIEIMIVISIIGLLSIILIPKVSAIRVQSKNKNVSANVLLVRTYLENRSGKDGISYQVATNAGKTTEQALVTILNSVGTDMTSNFSGSNALINPFNGNSSIIYSKGSIANKVLSSVSGVMAYYCTDTLPSSNNDINNNTIFPKGSDLSGNVIVVIYSTGYVLYGIDDSGQIVNVYIIKFPPTPDSAQSGVTPGNGGDSGGGNGGSSNGSTVGDLFAANCLNAFGDSSDQINLGNGSTLMNITGSVDLQGKQITFAQNTTVNGDLLILGSGDQNSIRTGNGGGNTLTVTGKTNIQAYNIDFNSNLNTNNTVYILANNNVTFDNSSISANFNNGTVQIQSGTDINFYSDVNSINSRISSVAQNNINFNNVGRICKLDNNSSLYAQAGKDMTFDYSANMYGPITMISGNNLSFNNNSASVNISGATYLKALNNINILRNVTLGSTYMETNTFSYGHSNINTSDLSTNITNYSHDTYGGTLSPAPVKVLPKQPQDPAVAPANNIPSAVTQQIKSVKGGVSYNSAYDTTTYKDLAFRIIRGSDTSSLKQALMPNGESINSNNYKFLIIDGDCTLDWQIGSNNFSNFIIYCTGTINLNYIDLGFNNSAIIAKNLNLKPSSSFNMTQLDSNQFNQNVKSEIDALCDKYLQ
ncbi:prepilin-type N-terminal cleavage/methylation domain-containing protein [Clostridium thailandense]|uniref:prepilin-type N-terminal cleavage/methylation domain-containing protein n=1 Tax=Clostridium thailandense TaxID=2794346 RepID=UPI0039892437